MAEAQQLGFELVREDALHVAFLRGVCGNLVDGDAISETPLHGETESRTFGVQVDVQR